MTTWKVIVQAATDAGKTVEMKYAEFGKGRAKVDKWEIFRDGVKVGYATNQFDAQTNFQRALRGLTHNPETGQYE